VLLWTFATPDILPGMKTYWLAVLALAVADAAVAALLLIRNGGPQGLVWWAFLIIPLMIVNLIFVGLILHLVIPWSQTLQQRGLQRYLP
jgi:hypothetical protein